MCAFGIALASGPNINAPVADLDTARASVARARRLVNNPDELRLIEALAARYAASDPANRVSDDSAYAHALGRIVEQAPNNLEAKTLYADALMNLSPWNYWNSDGSPRHGTRTILNQLESVLLANRNHPGACHLYIHAVEAKHPRRAVECAERLAALMPGVGHVVHMPAHIYIRVGRYADAVAINEHAVHADKSFMDGPHAVRRGIYASGYYPHSHHFLSFAAAMMGASELAINHAFKAAAGVDAAVAEQISWIETITPIGFQTLVTFGEWDRILAEQLPSPSMRFATGMAYYARGVAFAAKGRWAEADAARDSVARAAKVVAEGDNRTAMLIAELALGGEIALRRGRADAAIQSFQQAAVLEDAMPYNEPPVWYYPIRHSLGKALLSAGRFAEAERAYEEDLERFPENGWSLYGLVKALKGQHRQPEANAVLARFNKAWVAADVQLRGSRF